VTVLDKTSKKYYLQRNVENVWRYNTDTQELITIQPLAKAIQNFNWNAQWK
jgi:hypothetical protein